MGQKTDIKNIFQIGKNNKNYVWDSKYFEKKKNESNTFIFQNLEIKKFVEKILKDNGLILYKYKINFLESNIKIFISYLKLPKSQTIITQINNKQKLRLIKKRKIKKSYQKDIKKYLTAKKFLKNKKKTFKKKVNLNKSLLEKKILNKQKIKIFLLTNILLNKQKTLLKKNLHFNNIFTKKTQDIITSNLEKQKKVKNKINNYQKIH